MSHYKLHEGPYLLSDISQAVHFTMIFYFTFIDALSSN